MAAFQVTTSDNYALSTQVFEPAGPAKGALLIGGAMGVKQGFYRHLAAFLQARGWWVYTFDYRGIGKSRPTRLRELRNPLYEWGSLDIDALLGFMQERHPDLPQAFLGHSVGGQILGFSKRALNLDKVVLLNSQSGYWKHWRGWSRWRMWLNWNLVIPSLSHLFGYLPAKKLGFFEDLPKHVALQWAHWGRHPDYLRRDTQLQRFHEPIQAQLLCWSFSDDALAPQAAVKGLLDMYEQAAITHQHYAPTELGWAKVGHFGCFRPDKAEVLWQPLLDWLEAD